MRFIVLALFLFKFLCNIYLLAYNFTLNGASCGCGWLSKCKFSHCGMNKVLNYYYYVQKFLTYKINLQSCL